MAEVINKLIKKSAGVVVITTRLTRILRYVTKLDKVHVMSKGKIKKSAEKELLAELEAKGYAWIYSPDNTC
jgi:Fe-S cluster assembly ATP-binding protein